VNTVTDFRRVVLWTTLALVVLLAALSVCGAFLGADRAKAFFNSLPMAVYWVAFLITLLAGCLLLRRLLRVPALLLTHAGCMAILLGGLWGSGKGQQLQKAWLGRDIIPGGQMLIHSGQTESRVTTAEGNDVGQLPFGLTLEQFRIEYYEPGQLEVSDAQGHHHWTLPAEPNAHLDMGPPYGSITVVRTFRNFRIGMEKGASSAYDDPGPGSNPAIETLVTPPGGSPTRRFVFEQFPGHADPGGPLVMRYRRDIKDYVSEVKVLQNGNTAIKKAIEVNHPLYYGGYHFYQTSYGQDPQTGQMYTVLSVVSDSGLTAVFAGYLLLCVGVTWQCGVTRLRRGNKKEAL
jgi:hypothetical protein